MATPPRQARQLPPPLGPDPALHPGRAPHVQRRRRRLPGRVPALPRCRPTPSPASGCSTWPGPRSAWSAIRTCCWPTPADLPEAEARRRERARETAGGIVAYALDAAGRQACFALGGRLFVVDLDRWRTASASRGPAPCFDPRLAPTAAPSPTWPSGSCAGSGRRRRAAAGRDRLVVGEDDPCVSWGSAEFVAAEEMGRARGFWWSPDGRRLAVARVDTSPVRTWWVADAANPATRAGGAALPGGRDRQRGRHAPRRRPVRARPAPGGRLGPRARSPTWPRSTGPDGRPLTLTVQSRDQRRLVVLGRRPGQRRRPRSAGATRTPAGWS